MDQQHLDDLLSIYITKDGRVNANFSRSVNQLSEADKKRVHKEIEVRGLDEKREQIHRRWKVEQAKAKEDAGILRLPPAVPIAKPVEISAPIDIPTASTDTSYDEFDDEVDEIEDGDEVEDEGEDRRGRRIIYTDAEWDHLADLVYSMRRRHPLPPLTRLVTRALSQFPPDRRRKLVGPALRPVIERVVKKEAEAQENLRDYDRYRKTIDTHGKIPTRQELIAALTDEELAPYRERVKSQIYAELAEEAPTELVQKIFAQIPANEVVAHYEPEELLDGIDLPSIIGHAARMIVENLGSWGNAIQAIQALAPPKPKPTVKPPLKAAHKPTAAIVAPAPKIVRKPRVCILGLLPNQQQIIIDRLGERAELTLVDKNRGDNAIPENQDVILYWARFASHSMQDQAKAKARNGCQLITHHGGISKMLQKIEDALVMRN